MQSLTEVFILGVGDMNLEFYLDILWYYYNNDKNDDGKLFNIQLYDCERS